jgi:hypothetical protein
MNSLLLQEINLRDLQHRFYEQTSAPETVIWFALHKNSKEFVDQVLRSHFEEKIVDQKEIQVRDAFDALLDFYSQLEIASLVNFISEESVLSYHEQVKEVLAHPSVANYYCKHYPQLLPQLFLARTEGKFPVRYGDETTNAIPIYLEMLEVCRPIYEDSDIQSFLDCLDDYSVIGKNMQPIVSIDLVIETIGKPAEYMERLIKPEDERELLDDALQGFVRFLEFCQNFYRLLERSADLPLLQSEMWNSQSYWFKILRTRASKAIDAAVSQFSTWESMLEPSAESFDTTQASITKLRQTLTELFSNKYEQALVKAAQENEVLLRGIQGT